MRNRSKRIDVNTRIGLTKGNQEVIGFSKYLDNGRHLYNVKCNYCLFEYESSIENFKDIRRSGKSCRKCSNIQNKDYKPQTMTESQLSIVFSNYKSRAKFKKWDFDINREDFKSIIFSNCHYCGQEPNKFRQDRVKNKRLHDASFLSNGIDRKDCSIGYILGNCLPSCEDCNKAKRNLSYNQFLGLIKKIHNHKLTEILQL